MRRLKRLFIAAMLMVVSLVTYLSVTEVHATATATVTINATSYDKYLEYMEYWQSFDKDNETYENLNTIKKKSYMSSGDYTPAHLDSDDNIDMDEGVYIITIGSYYAHPMGDTTVTLTSWADVVSYKNSHPCESVTEYAPGDKIVFEFYLHAPAGFRSTQLGFDFGANGLGNAKALSDATTHKQDYDITSDDNTFSVSYNSSIMKAATSNGSSTAGSHPYTGGYLEGTAASITDNVFVGTIATTISDNAAGEYNLALDTNALTASFFGDSSKKYYSSNITLAGVTKIKVTSSTSNNTGLSSVKVGGSTVTTSGDTTIGTNVCPTYPSSEVATTTTSTSITVNTNDNGTIQNVYYVVKNDGETLTSIPTSNTASGSTGGKSGTFTISPTTWNPGQTVYAIVEVLASDGTTTGYNIIEIPKAKNSVKQLTGLTITSDGNPNTVTWNTSFTSGTTTYTIKIANDTKNLTFTPTFATDVNQKCTIGGASVTSGSQKAVDITTKPAYIDVIMTAQDTSTNPYRINLYYLSDDTSLNSTNPIQITYSGSTTGTLTASSSDGTNYSVTTPVGSTGFTIKANLGNNKQTLRVDIGDGNGYQTISGGSSTSTISFDSGLGASTKQVTFEVTAEDGTTKEYTVNISRTAADGSKDITAFTLYGVTDGANTQISGGFDSARVFTVADELDYSVSGVKFKATFPTSASAVATCGTKTVNLTNGALSDLFAFSGTAECPLTITIIVTAADTTDQTYTINVKRRAADDNAAVTVTIKNSGGTVLSYTYDSSDNSYTLDSELAYIARNVYIEITCGTYTKIKYKNTEISGQKSYALAETPYFDWVFQFDFLVCTEVNPSGYPLTVNIPRDAADQNVDLDSYSVVGKGDNVTYSKKSTSTAKNFNYEIPKSSAGDYFKLNLAAAKSTTNIYISTSVPTSGNLGTLYNPALNEYAIDTPLYVTLEAQGKATDTYVFNVTSVDERDNNPQIDNIVISGLPDGVTFTFEKSTDPTKTFATITVPYSVKSLTITPTLERGHVDDGGTSSWAKNDAQKATALTLNDNTLHFQGKAENGALSCDYIIIIHRLPGETGNLLTNLKINNTHVIIDSSNTSAPFTSSDNFMYYRFDRGVYTQATLEFSVSTGAEFIVSVNGGNSSNTSPYTCSLVEGGKVTVTIQVRSEKNKIDNVVTYNPYTIELYVADDKCDIDNIELLLNDGSGDYLTNIDGNPFDFNAGSYTTFVVPFARPSAIPSVTKASNSQNAVVTGETGKNLGVGNTTFTIKITSEYASLNNKITDQTKTYTIIVDKEAADVNNYLSELELYIGTEKVEFDKALQYVTVGSEQYIDNVLYTKELITAGSVVTLKYKTASNKATVDATSCITATLTSESTTSELSIKVINENKDARIYKIKVSTEKLELDKNKDITSIQVFADNDATKDLINFVAADPQFEASVRYTVQKVTLHFQLPAASLATLKVDGNEVDKNTLKYEYTLSTRPGANTINVECYAEDTSLAPTTYKIIITSLTPDEDNSLKTFTINGTAVSEGGTIKLPNSTDKIDIVAERNSQYATLSPVNSDDPSKYTITGKEINVGSNTVTIFVTNEKGETKEHTVTVIRDDVLTLDSLTVVNPDDPTNTNLVDLANPDSKNETETIFILDNLPYSTEKLDVSCITKALADNVTVTGVKVYELEDGKETICTITVTAKSGASHKYIIKATRASGDDKNFITSYKPTESAEKVVVGTEEKEITYVVPKSTLVFTPYIEVSEKAKVDPNTGLQYVITETNRNLSDGRNTFHITVTSQTGKENKYTFYVFRSDTDYNGTITLLESAGGPNIKDIDKNELVWDENHKCTLSFAYSTKMAYLNVETVSPDAVVYVDGKVFTSQTIQINGNHTYIIYIKSEYGVDNPNATNTESVKYELTINQEEANDDATLKTLKVLINGEWKEATQADLDSREFIIDNIGNEVSNIKIEAEATVAAPKTSISGTGIKILNDLNIDAGDGSVTGYIFSYPIIVTPEDPDAAPITYTVTVSRGPINLDEHNTIDCIIVTDSNGNKYLDENSFDPTDDEYEIEIPYGPQSYTITVLKLEVSPATITGAGQFQIKFTNGEDMYKEHLVFATSQKKQKGTEYKIKVTCKSPSSDSTLKDLKVDGVTVTGFDPETKDYVLTTIYPNDVTSLTIAAVVNDSNSKISGDLGTLSLKEGTNSFTVTVTAQDGSISNYKVIATRDYPLPYLTDLDIVGEKLLNDKDKETVFNKDVLVYHAIVTFMDMTATINASVDNPTHIVACSNSSVITNTGTTRTFTVLLNEGINRFTISVTSSNGKKQNYEVVIQRRGLASTNTNIEIADILEIEQFKNDYSNLQSVYEYTVPNKVRDLNVTVVCENVASGINEGATYKVYNDKNLKVGLNQVIILIIAEDTETTRAVLVNVTRLPMAFTINKEATEYTCTQSTKDDMTYVIDLGKNDASAITDYTKYIEFAEEDNLTVEVLTDTQKDDCREVIVRVSDGSEEQLVRFELLSTATTKGTSFNFVVWLLLAVAIVILGTILICVNKDKYGTISKKRKNA